MLVSISLFNLVCSDSDGPLTLAPKQRTKFAKWVRYERTISAENLVNLRFEATFCTLLQH